MSQDKYIYYLIFDTDFIGLYYYCLIVSVTVPHQDENSILGLGPFQVPFSSESNVIFIAMYLKSILPLNFLQMIQFENLLFAQCNFLHFPHLFLWSEITRLSL